MKVLNKLFIAIFAVALFASCSDTSDNFASKVLTENLEKGGVVRFADLNGFPDAVVFNADGTGSSRSIFDPNNNLKSVSFDLVYTPAGGEAQSFEDVVSSTTFPFDFNFSEANLSGWTGLPASTFKAGDNFKFVAEATREDGTVFTLENTKGAFPADAAGGYVHAMEFGFTLACPFVAEEAVGDYFITVDDFGTSLDYNSPIKAVVNDAGDGVVFKDIFKHTSPAGGLYDVEVKFTDPSIGVVTVEKQDAWHCDNFGCGYGQGRVNGSGTFFTCIGELSLNLTHTVDLGSFGTYALKLVKN